MIFHFEKEKIKFLHLKYAFVKNHNIKNKYVIEKIEDFLISKNYRKSIEKIKIGYTLKELSHKEYVDGVKLLRQGYLNHLEILGLFSEEDKFSSEQGLRNALTRIKKLGIITTEKDKKGYPFYRITDKGFQLYLRWKIHYLIDNFLIEDIDTLFKLQVLILDRAIDRKTISPIY